MALEVVLVLAIAALLALILAEVPVGLAIGAAGTLGVFLLYGAEITGRVVASAGYTATAKYALLVIPMYVLLGSLVANAGIGAGIYRVTNKIVGRFPGGLAATAIAATCVFSGISGSSAADVATFGRVSVTEMSKHGYARAEAAAIVAAAGAFAVLIPPSISLILYGVIAQVSIGALLLAAIVPGVLSALTLMTFVICRAIIRQRRGAPMATTDHRPSGSARPPGTTLVGGDLVGGEEIFEVEPERRHDVGSDLTAVLYAAVLFLIVVGGLYAGFFTATEAGAVAALAALVIAVVARRQRQGSLFGLLRTSFRETVDITSMIFLLLLGGSIFTYFLASSGTTTRLNEWVLGLPVAPIVLVAMFLAVMLPLGMFLDGLSIMLLTVPLVAPLVLSMGYDGVWFGVLVVKMIEIGLITPPVGINVFIIAGIAATPAEKIFRAAVPFVALDLALTAVLFAFPSITLWLPGVAGLS